MKRTSRSDFLQKREQMVGENLRRSFPNLPWSMQANLHAARVTGNELSIFYANLGGTAE